MYLTFNVHKKVPVVRDLYISSTAIYSTIPSRTHVTRKRQFQLNLAVEECLLRPRVKVQAFGGAYLESV